jgi:ketosteroid isomerase-like protein
MTTKHEDIARHVLEAWNAHDVERVVACYTPDLVYRDPWTRGEVRGADAFRRYLTKLFASWRMHWSTREIFPLAETSGTAALWRATLTPIGGGVTVEVDGMDLVVLAGDRLARNEVYFDRAALAPLMSSTVSTAQSRAATSTEPVSVR